MIFKNDVVYHCIGTELDQGILSCGYMHKPNSRSTQQDFVIGYYSCFVVLSGSGFYEDEQVGRIPLVPGDLVQRLPHVVHTTEIVPDGQWLEFYMSIGLPVFTYLNTLGLLETSKPVIHGVFELDEARFLPFNQLLKGMQLAERHDLPLQLLSLQKQVIKLHGLAHQQRLGRVHSMENAKWQLTKTLDIEFAMESLAKDLNMSYESFRKQFKTYTGRSPLRYRIEQKMKQARWMLLSGHSIEETAGLVGYGDVYAFTKQFKKTFGYPPGQFQRNQ